MMHSIYLAHHGIKGQKWGNRRYQYKDGSLTPEGRRRYGVGEYVKNRYNIEKARSKGYKRANSNFQRELADIDKNVKGTAQNKPVIRAAKKYDKARKSVRQKYKSEVKAENKKLYKYGKDAIKKRARIAKRTRKFLSSPDGVLLGSANVYLGILAGHTVAVQGGKALVKLAMKRNPNLRITDSDFNRLLDVAAKNGVKVGVAVGTGVTAYEAYRRSKAIEETRSKRSGSSSRKTMTSGSSGFASRKRKSDPWSEKPYNPYDYNWTERRSKNRSNI